MDDINISNRPAVSFEEELKRKAMTMGRKSKRKAHSEEENPPPPPPTRSHSRTRGNKLGNDCTSPGSNFGPPMTRVKPKRNKDNSDVQPTPTNKPERAAQQNTRSLVSSLPNSFKVDTVHNKPPRQPVQPPPQKSEHVIETHRLVESTESSSRVTRKNSKRAIDLSAPSSSGIASARASLQAKFAGEPTNRTTREPESQTFRRPKLPPKEIPEESPYQKPYRAVNHALPSAQQLQMDENSWSDNSRQPSPQQTVSRQSSFMKKKSPSGPPRVHRTRAASKQGYESNSDYNSSSGSGEFRNPQSVSVESISTRELSPPPIQPPPLPLKVAEDFSQLQDDSSQSLPKKKIVKHSKSFKKDLGWPVGTQKGGQLSEETNPTQGIHNQARSISKSPSQQSQLGLNSHSSAMDLVTMVSKGAHIFPKCVKVCKGFCSSICESFSKFDRLNLHFIKHSKVSVLKDQFSREEYELPLSSSLEFGLLYEGEGADMSQFLPRVEDIMELKPLPLAIMTTKFFDGGSPEKSFAANELLFVRKIVKTLLGKGRLLEVCTIDNQIKQLISKSEGDFSIHPMHVKTTLSTLIDQSIALPQQVYMLSNPGLDEYFPKTMTQQPVLLETVREKTSIICTIKGYNSEDEESSVMDVANDLGIQVEVEETTEQENRELNEITSTLYHNFHPLALKHIIEKQTKREYDLQCRLNQELIQGREMDGIHLQLPSCLTPTQNESIPLQFTSKYQPQVIQVEPSEIVSITSSQESDSDGSNYEDVASALAEVQVEVVKQPPERDIPLKKKSSNFFTKLKTVTAKLRKHSEATEVLDTPDYEDTDFNSPLTAGTQESVSIRSKAAPAEEEELESYEPVVASEEKESDYSSVRNMDNHLFGLRSTLKESSLSADTESGYVKLNGKIATIMYELNMLKQQVQKLSATVESLVTNKGAAGSSIYQSQAERGLTLSTSAAVLQHDKESDDERTKNREYLRTLTHQQILQMFDKMNMSNFKSAFKQKSINGKLLSELDDTALQETYEIETGYHRMKLMRVISGAVRAII